MPSEVTKCLRSRRVQVWDQAKWLTEEVSLQNRHFTAEEQSQWEVLNEELDSIDRRIKQALDAEFRDAQNRDVMPLEDAATVAQMLAKRRAALWEQLTALADTVATENRAFTAEEQGSWDVLHEELDYLDQRQAGALEQSKRSFQADEAFRRLNCGIGTEKVKRLRDRRLNVWEHSKELADKAADEDRVFTPREFGTWSVLYEELDDLATAISEAAREATEWAAREATEWAAREDANG